MREFKSAQELILAAAFCDGVSTTIRPVDQTYRRAIEVVFSKKDVHSSVVIDLTLEEERCVLYSMKRALYDLFEYPYRGITVKGGEYETSF